MTSRLHVTSLVWIGLLTLAVLQLLSGNSIGPDWFKPLSTVVTVTVLAIAVGDRYLWRFWPLNPYAFHMPVIAGTWRCVVRPTDQANPQRQIEAYVVIRQTFSTLRVRLFTSESESESLAANVRHCDDETFSAAWVYHATPRMTMRDNSPLHHGGVLLRIHGEPVNSLAGEYWTDRHTQGELELTERRRHLASKFDDAKQLFAVPAPKHWWDRWLR